MKHPDKEGHRAMTTSITVPIPEGVKDNSRHTVRVTSRDVSAESVGWSETQHLEYYRAAHASLGYAMHEFDTIDRDGNRVTFTWFADLHGEKIVRLYETSYYTRIGCARCPHRWAQVYVVIEQGEFKTKPEPLCSDHYDRERIRANRSQRGGDGIAFTLHRSEWLRIGQH